MFNIIFLTICKVVESKIDFLKLITTNNFFNRGNTKNVTHTSVISLKKRPMEILLWKAYVSNHLFIVNRLKNCRTFFPLNPNPTVLFSLTVRPLLEIRLGDFMILFHICKDIITMSPISWIGTNFRGSICQTCTNMLLNIIKLRDIIWFYKKSCS